MNLIRKRMMKKADFDPEMLPDKMYHATFEAFMPSIQEKGLTINNPDNWDGDIVPGAVYLATNPDIAESYAEEANVDDDVYDSGIVILEIDTSKLDISKFGPDENVVLDEDEIPETFAYYDNIPASAFHKM